LNNFYKSYFLRKIENFNVKKEEKGFKYMLNTNINPLAYFLK